MTAETLLPWTGRGLTLAEWDAVPHDEEFRVELVEGVLWIVANPRSWHQKAMTNLTTRLEAQLPSSLVALPAVDVLLADPPPTVRAPDVVVTPTAVYETNPARLAATDALLVVEILSDGTRKVDRVLKFAEYAEAGIPQYWIVDLDAPASLLAFTLVDGFYERSGEFTGAVELAVDGHPVTVDPATLARR